MFKPPSRNTGYITGVVQLRNFENCIPFVWPPATLTSILLKNNVGGYYVLLFFPLLNVTRQRVWIMISRRIFYRVLYDIILTQTEKKKIVVSETKWRDNWSCIENNVSAGRVYELKAKLREIVRACSPSLAVANLCESTSSISTMAKVAKLFTPAAMRVFWDVVTKGCSVGSLKGFLT